MIRSRSSRSDISRQVLSHELSSISNPHIIRHTVPFQSLKSNVPPLFSCEGTTYSSRIVTMESVTMMKPRSTAARVPAFQDTKLLPLCQTAYVTERSLCIHEIIMDTVVKADHQHGMQGFSRPVLHLIFGLQYSIDLGRLGLLDPMPIHLQSLLTTTRLISLKLILSSVLPEHSYH